MSGGGGYFKYRCKYWMTHNCESWVWVNGTACINCLAQGRESDQILMSRIIDSVTECDLPQIGGQYFHEAAGGKVDLLGAELSFWEAKMVGKTCCLRHSPSVCDFETCTVAKEAE